MFLHPARKLAVILAAALIPLAPAAPAAAQVSSVPTAWWRLDSFPGITQAAALEDWVPSRRGDTPLTAVDISWEDDARLVGGQSIAFNGASSYLRADPSALDTAGTFAVAAWVRLTDASVSRDFFSKAGLSIGYDHSTNRWQAGPVRSLSAPRVGVWTHITAVHDAADGTLKLYVDGEGEAAGHVPAVDDPTAEVRVGRGANGWWKGNVADLALFDRTLVGQDFHGWDTGSGLLTPFTVADWRFNGAVPCYEDGIPDTCEAPDSVAFDRWLALTRGTDIDSESSARGSFLALDDTHMSDGGPTREFARSQTSGSPRVDTPVMRTDQSFTVAVWVRLDPARGAQTVAAQDDFRLGYDPTNGWEFAVPGGVATAPATAVDQWRHVVVVYDALWRQARIFVDGEPAATEHLGGSYVRHDPSGALVLGRWLFGSLDDIRVYQGVLSWAEVQRLFVAQSGP